MSSIAVCALSEIESGKVRKFVVNERSIAVVRIDDKVYAIGAFSLETGKPNTLPATKAVPVYAASVLDGQVMITIGDNQ
jgi:nitrite reductase/ring-hydroxylating ferredoxin subunit